MNKSIEYYNINYKTKVGQYEKFDLLDFHPELQAFDLTQYKDALDIGCGSGRDAAGLATFGLAVTAVDPSLNMLNEARIIHNNTSITWIQDSLPQLYKISKNIEFDIIIISAVWMHLNTTERPSSFARVAQLLRPKGLLLISYKTQRTPSSIIYEIPENEIPTLALEYGLTIRSAHSSADSLNRSDISWQSYILTR